MLGMRMSPRGERTHAHEPFKEAIDLMPSDPQLPLHLAQVSSKQAQPLGPLQESISRALPHGEQAEQTPGPLAAARP